MSVWTGFKDKEDIALSFEIPVAKVNEYNVLVAFYDSVTGYDGYAFLLLSRHGKLFEVHADHCSCHGLEGQFEPEETTRAVLKARMKNGGFFYRSPRRAVLVSAVLNELQILDF